MPLVCTLTDADAVTVQFLNYLRRATEVVFTCEEAASGEKIADKEIDASTEERFRVLQQGMCFALLI
jgi:hypothetical protein